MRLLIEHPLKGWKVLSVSRGMAAQRGELLLPALANRTVRVALAYVQVGDGGPARLVRVELLQWVVDATGRVKKNDLLRSVREKLDGATAGVGDMAMELTARDMEAIARCLSVTLSAS